MIKAIITFLIAVTALSLFGQDTCVAIKPEQAPRRAASIWGQVNNFWPQKARLKVRFMTGTTRQKAAAWKRFLVIDKLINLDFVQVTTGDADIRVRFDKGKGHWSFVGIGNRTVAQGAATMNLDLTAGIFGDLAAEWDRVALHEICHAIGIEHEHQHPSHGIPWDTEAVYRYYGQTQGWTRSQIRYQVLERYAGSRFKGTAFDPTSIMQYPVPAELTGGKFSVGWNSAMSPTDIAFLRALYPTAP